MNLRRLNLAFVGRPGALDLDFDQVGARAGARVHAARRDQLGLGERVGREGVENGGEVVVGQVVGLAAEEAADVALGEASPPGEFGLVHAAALDLALKGGAEVAHFFALQVSFTGFSGDATGVRSDEHNHT